MVGRSVRVSLKWPTPHDAAIRSHRVLQAIFEKRGDDGLTYVQVTCLACAQAHLMNPKIGKVMGSDDE
jgi:hypothetical protein